MKHINLYLDDELLEALENRSDGRRQGWNRSAVARAVLRLYLGVVEAAPPDLPEGAWPVLHRLLSREAYTRQLGLIPRIVETHPHLEHTCARHQVDPDGLCRRLRQLDTRSLATLLDHLLLSGGSS